MTLLKFCEAPFQENHPLYDSSCLSIGVQPEYATGDVLIGSCYRALRLVRAQESEVDLEQINELPDRLGSDEDQIGMWQFVFEKALRSPVRPQESSTRPLPQLVPLVPSLAEFSGVLGRRRSRWNPGRLALYTLASGVGPLEFPSIAEHFAQAINVTERADDQFAIFLERHVSSLLGNRRAPVDETWQVPELKWAQVPHRQMQDARLCPAEALAEDLRELITLKPYLTRRQWCALLESLLRLGLSAHVLWVCRLNCEVWRSILEVLDGNAPPSQDELARKFWSTHLGQGPFLDGGQSSDSYLKRQIESYAIARLGINLVLHQLDDASAGWTSVIQDNATIPSAIQINDMLTHIYGVRSSISADPRRSTMSLLGPILDEKSSSISSRSGPPKNLHEFLVHTLRRRPSKDPSLNEHDQGYLLAKLSASRNAPWIVRPGPVLLMAMCYATCKSMRGAPVNLQHLARRFSFYGVRLSTGDLQDGMIASDLASLGVLVDSPDASGGRLVLNPFEVAESFS